MEKKMAYAKEITSMKELEAVMSPDAEPAMIDFWASWCGPCRAMAPHYEAAAEALKDEPVHFYKIDTEAHPDLVGAFNVRGLPTVLMIKEGKVADALVGARDGQTYKKKAEWLMGKEQPGLFKKIFG